MNAYYEMKIELIVFMYTFCFIKVRFLLFFLVSFSISASMSSSCASLAAASLLKLKAWYASAPGVKLLLRLLFLRSFSGSSARICKIEFSIEISARFN